MRIGILFGGCSKEREVSFASGRMIYDSIDKSLFEPVPIFIDSLSNFIILETQYLYRGTIRDFYPPHMKDDTSNFQTYIEALGDLTEEKIDELINKIGKRIYPNQFSSIFDFAFLALHGPSGEDGSIQGLLEWYGIPYSGTGILGSAIGINKLLQKDIMKLNGLPIVPYENIRLDYWESVDKHYLLNKIIQNIGMPIVIKSVDQGSSIGVSILKEENDQKFKECVNKAFGIYEVDLSLWRQYSQLEKNKFIANIIDISDGIGLPIITFDNKIYNPLEIRLYLDGLDNHMEVAKLKYMYSSDTILIEQFIHGREFSCIVIQQDDNEPIALPPTEMIKNIDFFTYKAKYLPGMVRKNTPMETSKEIINSIREQCVSLFKAINCQVYARIDGFLTNDNKIFLNDPNTTAGMSPSSFIFQQTAEVGINPTQFITFVIQNSINKRVKEKKVKPLYLTFPQSLKNKIKVKQQTPFLKKKIGVIMGGFSSERHISLESGKNVYQKLISSSHYEPIPIFLTGAPDNHRLFLLPLKLLLKDNADDINNKCSLGAGDEFSIVPSSMISDLSNYISEAYRYDIEEITYATLGDYIDFAFIALHGRPGEDGQMQQILEQRNIPYNGSNASTSLITINKFLTNQILSSNGVCTAKQLLVNKKIWLDDSQRILKEVKQAFSFPIILKPVDDGCSYAVVKTYNEEQLASYANCIFREPNVKITDEAVNLLSLDTTKEFPVKDEFLVEEFISKGDADLIMEVTVGFLTSINKDNKVKYEIFQPSETVSLGEVLSLEEKFLAGQGQNITPAHLSSIESLNKEYIAMVQSEIEQVAKILKLEGYGRVDAFVKVFNKTKAIKVYIIEVNTLPAMTPATCIFHQSAINGYTPVQFIDRIIQYGFNKQLIYDKKT